MGISEKIAYLKGLMEGMNVDTESNEGKLFAAVVDVLDEIALEVEDLTDEVMELGDGLDVISDDLSDVEDIVYDEWDDDDDDDDEDEHEHHHHHEDGEECCCHHHHDDDHDDHEHHHHHDHDDHDEDEHEHHHHDHEDGETCSCGHHHHHHHGHDADEVFVSVGVETANRYEQDEVKAMLDKLSDEEEYGTVLRAKGVLQNAAGDWFQFDYVPGESQFRPGTPDYTGRLCVIGAHIDEKALRELFKA